MTPAPSPRELGEPVNDLLKSARQEIALWRATMPHPVTPPTRLRLLDALVARCEQEAARAAELEAALYCDHTLDPDEHWQFVEHEAKTWSRCKACGLMELWEGGMRCKIELPPAALASPPDSQQEPTFACPRGHRHFIGSAFCSICGAGPVLADSQQDDA